MRKKMLHYRIDRMKNVELMGEARDGADEFKALDFEAMTVAVAVAIEEAGK